MFHILTAIAAWFIVGFFELFIQNWLKDRSKRALEREASAALNIPIRDINEDRNRDRLLSFLNKKFSVDLINNRFSDFCGIVLSLITGLGWLLQISLMGSAIYIYFNGSSNEVAIAWGAPALSLLLFFHLLAFSYGCKIITGRYPGQSKIVRRLVAQQVDLKPYTEVNF